MPPGHRDTLPESSALRMTDAGKGLRSPCADIYGVLGIQGVIYKRRCGLWVGLASWLRLLALWEAEQLEEA